MKSNLGDKVTPNLPVAVPSPGKARDNVRVIFPRLISIALRRYTSEPETRNAAVRLLAMNAIRLCVAHLGSKETASLALLALSEDPKSKGSAG